MPKPGFVTRSTRQHRAAPASLNEDARTVEVVGATSDPCLVWDWERWAAVNEVLLMSGLRLPPHGQVPLLDSHDSRSVANVLGSYRLLRTEGQTLVGEASFSGVAEGLAAFAKVREGHLTDYSVGYNILAHEEIKEGVTVERDGLTIEGPCRLVTAWELMELSICPIGADPAAKARANGPGPTAGELGGDAETLGRSRENKKEKTMPKIKNGLRENPEDKDITEEIELDEETREDEANPEKETEEEARADCEEDDDKARAASPLAERQRVREIIRLGRAFGLSEKLTDSLIEKGTGLAAAREAIMKHLERERGAGPRVSVLSDERESFRLRASDSLRLRAGRALAKPNPGAEELRGLTLRELARECLVRANQRVPGNPLDMVKRALTTSDLPMLLIESARRFLEEGFEQAPETWPLWTGEGTAPDFRETKIIDSALDNQLLEVGEGDEYEYTEMVEAAEVYKVATYGRMFAISRQAIINDDLGAITDVPASLGEGVSRLIGDGVYGCLVANSKMGDGLALFHANHNNLLTGGGAPTVDTLGAADTAMGLQKDLKGRRLNIRPEFFLAPVSLRIAAETFFNTEMIGTQALPTTRNLYHGSFIRVYEPRLDDDDKNTWYLCGPRRKGVRVIYLNGIKTPYLESQEGFNVDGLTHKVRFDVGVKAVSWRGLVKSAKAS